MAEACRRDILGVSVLATEGGDAIARILRTIEDGDHERYAFLNAHGANIAYRDASFQELLGGFKVLPDGAGVDIASRWLYGAPFPENLNGTDFVPRLLGEQQTRLTVGLWGAEPGIAHDTAAVWRAAFPAHTFRVLGHGFAGEAHRANALNALRVRPVDILLVAMGNPRQERFIADYIDRRHARVAIGVGALFDFASGRVRRAPRWLRRARAEWLFRLALEPARLSTRYLVGNPLFLARVRRQRRLVRG